MNSKRVLLVFSLLVFSALSRASVLSSQNTYYPKDFYAAVESGLHDSALKDRLFEILSQAHIPGKDGDTLTGHCADESGCYQHTALGYDRARQILFGEIHLTHKDSGYAILEVYCQKLETEKDFGSHPHGPGKIPDSTIVNTEHTWPQSKFSSGFNRELQKSDLINLYPTDDHANSVRSSYKFGDVVAVTDQPCAASKLGFTSDGGKEPHFEVPMVHKGNVARSIFYFSVRYRLPVSADEEASLKAWHRADPPDEFERQRNETIFKYQRDRNPFIDHPELVELISDF